ncbi:Gfo/Idh/MocA family oxidoreductase, partial [Patescibacteria group bacterium]|nr:Gfo/Idh/MocA family oxidoreductase [Patescibacteria group bacterium]MBU1449186.1 Gfo/Idh/MocA family oxidoreductase [Patescibacteria group bacterium]
MAATEQSYKDLSALVVGLGSIGLRHLDNLRALGVGRLGALRRRGAELHREVDLSDVALFQDFDEALGHGWDAVFIANPTAMHLEAALLAAGAGCNLYLEKPISHSLAGVDELSGLVERKGLVVEVGCQLRFDPTLEKVKSWLEQGAIGSLVSANCQVGEWLPGWHPWEDYRASYAARPELGGGVVLTTIHEIDYLLWLLGGLQVRAAMGGVSGALEIEAEDHVAALLTAERETPVLLSMDYLSQPPIRSLRLIGTQGHICWDYMVGSAQLWLKGKMQEEKTRQQGWRRNDMFLAITRDFLEAVQNGSQPR